MCGITLRSVSVSAVLLTLIILGGGLWLKGESANAARKNGAAQQSSAAIDPRADSLMKVMSTYLSNLPQFTVDTRSMVEAVAKSEQKFLFWNDGRVWVRRPDRLRMEVHGDPLDPSKISIGEGRRPIDAVCYYDGKTFTLYGKKIGLYASAAVSPPLDSVITFARECLDIDAPAADLFYKDVYAGLMDGVTSGLYLGMTELDSVPCHQCAFRSRDVDWEIWIAKGPNPLPMRYVITSKNVKGMPDFGITLSNWNVSTPLPDSLFDFKPTQNAQRIEFQSPKCGRSKQ